MHPIVMSGIAAEHRADLLRAAAESRRAVRNRRRLRRTSSREQPCCA